MLYGAPLSTIADTQGGSGPAHSKVMRGARAKVLTAAPIPTRAANASRAAGGCNPLAAVLNQPGGP